jgi:Zn ribbon nucleic-acid-binding protein
MTDAQPRPKRFSPTAQCPHCKSWKTRSVALYAAKGLRTHKCIKCDSPFRTAMAEVASRAVAPKRNKVKELAAKAGISRNAMSKRLRAGWSPDEAVSIPLGTRRKPVSDE